MIRRVKYAHKKPIHDPRHAGLCDAVMNRARDNPYRPGSTAHQIYEDAYSFARIRIEEERDDEREAAEQHSPHGADQTPCGP